MEDRVQALEINLQKLLRVFVETAIENHALRTMFYSRQIFSPKDFGEACQSARYHFLRVLATLSESNPDSFARTLQALQDTPEKEP
jgi:hypothetical protein